MPASDSIFFIIVIINKCRRCFIGHSESLFSKHVLENFKTRTKLVVVDTYSNFKNILNNYFSPYVSKALKICNLTLLLIFYSILAITRIRIAYFQDVLNHYLPQLVPAIRCSISDEDEDVREAAADTFSKLYLVFSFEASNKL